MEIGLEELAKLLDADLVGPWRARKQIQLCTDSRKLKKGQIFWALSGDNFDGHVFANEVFKLGGSAAVVSKNWHRENGQSINVYIPVDDPNTALLALAKRYAAKFRIPKIGVTGSNGKTTTKDMIVKMLSQAGNVLGTQGNFNNHVGVPLTLFELKSHHDFAVIEIGMSHPGEIRTLSDVVSPTLAVITNVGTAHLEHMGSQEKIAEEKLSIASGFKTKGTLIINVDDPYLAKARSNAKTKLLTYGLHRGQIRPDELTYDAEGCASFRIGRTEFKLQVPGEHNVYNALAAIAVGTYLRLSKKAMVKGLRSFTASPNRLQIKKLNGLTVIDDSYNANPTSTKTALSTLGSMQGRGRCLAVLGDMLELGDEGPAMHLEIGRYLVEMGVTELFTFGTLSRFINQGAREKGMKRERAHHFLDFNLLCAELIKNLQPGDTLLVKGSHGMHLERVYEFLKDKLKMVTTQPEESINE